jgi:hypothetical protein
LTPLWMQTKIKTPQYQFYKETESYRGWMNGQGLKRLTEQHLSYFYHYTPMTDHSY